MTSGVLPVLGLLLVALALVVIPPLLASERQIAPATRRDRRRGELETRRDELYQALRDAELDWRTGKLTEEDHAALRERLLAEAGSVLRDLDALGGEPESPSPGSPDGAAAAPPAAP